MTHPRRHIFARNPYAAPPGAPRATAALAALLALVAAPGCVGVVRTPAAPASEVPRKFEAAPAFRYTVPGPVTLSAPVDAARFHDLLELSYESVGPNGAPENRVEALYYRSRSAGPLKLVVVLPIWGTSEYPPSRISSGYARHSKGNAHVIWIRDNTRLFPWDAMSATESEAEFVSLARTGTERFRTTVANMRRLIDWAETRPEIDAERIAFVGFSMSALVTATLLGNEDRVAAAVLMMGAARYAEVFATCGDRTAAVREHALRTHGWSLQRYRSFFEHLFAPAEPLRFAGRYDPSRILLFEARFDNCMPPRTRDALWEAMGRPERITLWLRHRSAFYSLTPLGLNFARRRIYEFLDGVL